MRFKARHAAVDRLTALERKKEERQDRPKLHPPPPPPDQAAHSRIMSTSTERQPIAAPQMQQSKNLQARYRRWKSMGK